MTDMQEALSEALAEQDAAHQTAGRDAIVDLRSRNVELHSATGAGGGAPADTSGIRGSRGLDLPAPVRIDVVDQIVVIDRETAELTQVVNFVLRRKVTAGRGRGRAQATHERLVDLEGALPDLFAANRVTALDVLRRVWILNDRAGVLLGQATPAYRLAGATCSGCGMRESLWTFPEQWQTVCGNPSCTVKTPVSIPAALLKVEG